MRIIRRCFQHRGLITCKNSSSICQHQHAPVVPGTLTTSRATSPGLAAACAGRAAVAAAFPAAAGFAAGQLSLAAGVFLGSVKAVAGSAETSAHVQWLESPLVRTISRSTPDCWTSSRFSYHPQSDGQTERVSRVLEELLRHYVSPTRDDWNEHWRAAEFAVNNAKHESARASSASFLDVGAHCRLDHRPGAAQAQVRVALQFQWNHVFQEKEVVKANMFV